MAFWWCIFRQLRSKETYFSRKLFVEQKLIQDNFFDFDNLKSYHQEFGLLFYQKFSEFPTASLKYYCRYKCGLIIYHSMLYSRRQSSNSYSVCVKDATNPIQTTLYYGDILFFFDLHNEPFFFF